MKTIKNTDFTSNIDLAAILMVRTKETMMEISRKLDLYGKPQLEEGQDCKEVGGRDTWKPSGRALFAVKDRATIG